MDIAALYEKIREADLKEKKREEDRIYFSNYYRLREKKYRASGVPKIRLDYNDPNYDPVYDSMWKHGLETTLYIKHSKWCVDDPIDSCWLCRSVSEFKSHYGPRCPFEVPAGDQGIGGTKGFIHKPHYACFDCCRGWKCPVRIGISYYPFHPEHYDKYIIDIPKSKCTWCGNFGKYVGLNFRTPGAKDKKGWLRSKKMFEENPKVFEAKCKHL
jgi:hypothetical protein